MAPGFLAVFSEPGKQVTLEEFQDWYNNEHVPLRLNYLLSFLTGARFSASDGKLPTWLAVYDIDDTATFQHESYTRLRANRSPREGDLVKRLELLDRRTYELSYDSGESQKASSFKSAYPTKVIVTYGITFEDGQIKGWIAEVEGKLSSMDGWIRTRAYLCIDNLKTGVGVPEGSEAQKVPKYLIIHEVTSAGVLEHGEVTGALSAPGIEEVRTWELYRAYPCVAQGNLGAPSA
ncbi:uncharacterized protein BT62DRAFT_928037 [Guyanagaster necrorhizus]|uniref:EthD domain-containing protein n=1 Tax=Guyanagaster necrorhizus TaxID=856835 RepID=A0A9P7W1C0_9AGAR|nr:uncharacterized protein BT62DRAFT_928037 [Guyanagaster necrorhizus MCA 3950]KAG7450759.1 hypothetical protein BT62DRAFT_928037 [Guyanagaster necrorhizus MCA 3950]